MVKLSWALFDVMTLPGRTWDCWVCLIIIVEVLEVGPQGILYDIPLVMTNEIPLVMTNESNTHFILKQVSRFPHECIL